METLFGRQPLPTRLGRFGLVRELGRGAMGTVWLARDDQLERDVALKVLHRFQGEHADDSRRVLREARALAKVSDRHVVAVHEVGEHLGIAYVAMELVGGMTLSQWLAARPRRETQILAVFRQAAQGLAAVHRAGLIHRDFKPDNVLVDRGSRVVLADFGLAAVMPGIASGEHGPRSVDGPNCASQSSSVLGALVGTPAYMAPEQLTGTSGDARSDQFAFCVALHEAITGVRPFGGDGPEALLQAMDGRPWARGARPLRRRLRSVLERGLHRDPQRRYPTMEALLRDLPSGRSVWWSLRTLPIPLLAALALLRRDDEATCAVFTEQITRAGAAPEWNPAPEVEAAPFARAAWDAATRGLETRSGHALEQLHHACGRASVSEPAARAHLHACVARIAGELGDVVVQMQTGSVPSLAAAPYWAWTAGDLQACLHGPANFVNDEQTRALLRSAREHHAAMVYGTSAVAEHERVGLEVANASMARVSGGPLSILGRLLRARFEARRGDFVAAEADLRAALAESTSAVDDGLRAQVLVALVAVVGNDRDRADEAERIAAEAEVLIDATTPSPLLRAQLDAHRGQSASRNRNARGKIGVDYQRRAVSVLEGELGPEHPDVLAARSNLASALARIGEHAQAESILRATLGPARAVWGQHHPHLGRLYGALSNVLLRRGELGEAELWATRALALAQEVYGPDDNEVSNALYNLAMVLRRTDPSRVPDLLARGLSIRQAVLRPDDPSLIPWWVALGEANNEIGEFDRAERLLRHALQVCETDGAPVGSFARVRMALAVALQARDPAEALGLARYAHEAFIELGQLKDAARASDLIESIGARRKAGGVATEPSPPEK